jgi:hypothetical protein
MYCFAVSATHLKNRTVSAVFLKKVDIMRVWHFSHDRYDYCRTEVA